MKVLNYMLLGSLLVASAVAPIWVYCRGQDAWRGKNTLLQQRILDAERLAVENSLLSNIVAKERSPRAISQADLSELLRLRNEIGQLRSMLGETNRLDREIAQLRRGLKDLEAEKANNEDSPTARLDAQTELREARLEKLNQWLAQRPEETIPELRFLPADSWLKSAEWTRVTDEEYASWMSSQRSNAEMKFADMAFKALKRYAAANHGSFPTDLSQLDPYFEVPVEDIILQRYHIVPTKSLHLKFLQEAGGDWVITQKAPVNRQYDMRITIGLKGSWSTIADGKWDDVR